MDAIVAGSDLNVTAVDRDAAVRVNRIIRRVDVERAARDGDVHAGFQTFGAFLEFIVDGASAAGGEIKRPAVDRQLGFGLNAVHACGDIERAAFDEDVALRGVFIVVGLQPITARVDGDRSVFDRDEVSAFDAVVDGIDRDDAAGDFEIILTGDAVVVIRVDGQRAAAVDDKVILAEKSRVRFIYIHTGEDVFNTVGNDVLGPVCKRDDGFICAVDEDRRTGRIGDIHTVQDYVDSSL